MKEATTQALESGAGVLHDVAAQPDAPRISHEPSEQTMLLLLGYNGSGFSGFAEQQEAHIRTVAGELRSALETFLRRDVALTCAGRTDAGVHALGQMVSLPVFAGELQLDARRILRALGALTPPDISVRQVFRAPAGFSARFDACARYYRYRISAQEVSPVLMKGLSWWYKGELDRASMQQAARVLIGEHDFKSFCRRSSAEGKSTVRRVFSIDIVRTVELGEELIAIDISANAFLHSMVRTLVGSLVEVGSGRQQPQWMADVLAKRDRSAAGQTAPAEGLELMHVDYAPGSFELWDAAHLCIS